MSYEPTIRDFEEEGFDNPFLAMEAFYSAMIEGAYAKDKTHFKKICRRMKE